MSPRDTKPDRLLRIKAVCEKVGFKKTKVYELISVGQFPPKVPLPGKVACWSERQLDEWIQRASNGGFIGA